MAKYQGHYSNQGGHYIGAWGYVGLQILYFIPVIGFICLLVHACSPSHENRCKYARSYFCWLLVAIILFVITVGIICVVNGNGIIPALNEIWDSITSEFNRITDNGAGLIEKGRTPLSH